MDARVLIQAGHEGGRRNSGSGSKPSKGTNGNDDYRPLMPEREMTPIVADKATEILRGTGITVVRENGFFDKNYTVELAVYLHFDGSNRSCSSGASVGYPQGNPVGSNKPTANLWKDIYEDYWPYQWMPDNFTKGLRGYYGYAYTSTSIAEMLIEFGEISCPEQDAWLQPRKEWLGELVAHFCAEAIGEHGLIPDPGPFTTDPGRLDRRIQMVKDTYETLGRRLERLWKEIE